MKKSLINTRIVKEKRNINIDKIINENEVLKFTRVALIFLIAVLTLTCSFLFGSLISTKQEMLLVTEASGICYTNLQSMLVEYANCMCGTDATNNYKQNNPFNAEPPSILMPEYKPNGTE